MNQFASFVPGRKLSRQLTEILMPRLREYFPDLPIAIAHIGPGSDVLAFDTSRSMDHDWGPACTVIVPESRVEEVGQRFNDQPGLFLPSTVAGFSTRFSRHPDGTTRPDAEGSEHRVRITSVQEIVKSTLVINSVDQLSDAVWLSTPMQVLLEITAGEVFVDDTGHITDFRQQLTFYPDHIWRYQLAGFWMRVSQMQPLIGRSHEMGDQAGAATIALGILRDLMRIGLVQSRQYAPYAKWLGTAFSGTDIGQTIDSHVNLAVMNVTDFALLERAMNEAGCQLIRQLNGLELIDHVEPAPTKFWDRPFQVLPAEKIALALTASINGSGLKRFRTILGGIDAMTDSTDALVSTHYRIAVRAMFESK